MPNNQSGVSYIPVIFLIIIIIGAGIFFSKSFQILNSPSVQEDVAVIQNSPSPSPVTSPSPLVSASTFITVKSSIKPSSLPKVTPSPSNTAPAPSPSAIPGSYKLDCQPNCSFSMHESQSFSVGATIADSNGKYIANQSDFEYQWSLDDSSLGSLGPFDTCLPGVNPPCPLDHAIFNPAKHGSTMIRLKVKNKKDSSIAGETSFNVTVD